MKAEIISIGDELTSGSVQNTNATFIGNQLHTSGIEVEQIKTVRDDMDAIVDTVRGIQNHISFVIVTGGLGPTVDDITTKAAAEALRKKLLLNKTALSAMEERFKKFDRPMSPHNIKQAYLPSGSTIIPNPIGTACGFSIAKTNTLFFFLPGVPREMRRMMDETVLPLIKKEHPDTSILRTSVLKIFGKTESYCDQALSEFIKSEPEIAFAFLPRYPEITLKLTMRGSDKKYIEKKLRAAERKVCRILGDIIFGKDEETLELVVGNLLRSTESTLSVAESCTGGLITHRLTNIPGSSDYLERSLVVYSNKAKRELLKVPVKTLNRSGAVSQETAEYMAKGIKQLSKTTFGLAVTGIAGPGGGTEEKPVGTVFISLAHKRQVVSSKHMFYGDRKQVKYMVSQYALDILRKYLVTL